jgi:hypothetical protein
VKPPSKIPLPSLNQVLGIGVCTSAASPIIFLMGVVSDMLGGVSLSTIAAAFWSVPSLEFVLGCVAIAIFALPSFIAIGIGARALAPRKHDTFIVCTACGAVIGYVALSITLTIAMKFTRHVDFADPFKVWNVGFLALFSSIMSGLYWCVAVRRDRRHRQMIEEQERAIRAME